jgi:hypothetical protein
MTTKSLRSDGRRRPLSSSSRAIASGFERVFAIGQAYASPCEHEVASRLIVLCTSLACDVDELPPCPALCFDFTLERSTPRSCNDEDFAMYDIAFAGQAPEATAAGSASTRRPVRQEKLG